jgi:hypothetical protein
MLSEMKEARKMQNSHKAPGKNGIPAELLKQGGSLACSYIRYGMKRKCLVTEGTV